MPYIRTIISKSFISLTTLLLFSASAVPVTTFADASSDSTVSCTAPVTAQPGVHTPTGSDAATFTYQCDGQYKGDWTNAYYLYNPASNTQSPLYSPNYSYDCTAGTWTMDDWSYSAAQLRYIHSRDTISQPIGQTANCPVAPAVPSANATASNTANPTTATSSTSPGITGLTGPGSTTTSNLSADKSTNLNNLTNATVNNGITAVAQTGNATVIGNTSAGNATSGNSIDQANIINLLQSSSSALGNGQQVKTFTANINGDVNGDLLFDPSSIGNLQNASGTTDLSNKLTVNTTTNAQLNNTIDLNAASGAATVSGNTSGGNATTGSAQAIANVMNYINSAVTSGQSFIGTININGNLNGDILLPANLIDQLIASNVPTVNVNIPAPGSTNTNNTTIANDVAVNNTNNQGINNSVSSSANSGQATVSGNTAAGNATSGGAMTNVTAFNLTGSTVIGQNDILVFVNVLGKWVGMIVNAPAGSTAASLGGGITRNTSVTNAATLNNTANESINNNIKVAAKSGDATVSGNTKGGNATTGKAETAVNLLNIEGSTLDLTNWFGILFINVFGTWHGSFGVNTSAGDPVIASSAATAGAPFNPSSAVVKAQVFRFIPRANSGFSTFASISSGNNAGITPSNLTTPQAAVLAAHTSKSSVAPTPALQAAHRSFFTRPATIIGGLVVLYILADAVISRRGRTS
jgi:hypothetical protein